MSLPVLAAPPPALLGAISDILLPSTDGGVAVQVAALAVLGPIAIAASWRNPEIRLFAIGVVVITLAWFALRTVH